LKSKNIKNDNRIVMTLDAGGTNFVFSAIKSFEKIVEDIKLPSHGNDLDKCMKSILDGFKEVSHRLNEKPAAISFAFPGPADYPNGIIGDLPNLPAFRGGIALGPMLKEYFGIPVFINNDGDLYAYGEAISGFLPEINNLLEKSGSSKRYNNLLGFTLGTGFGCGIVHDGKMFRGDNSCGAEIWLMRNKLMPNSNVEEHGGIKGLKNLYAKYSNLQFNQVPEPKDIFDIGLGKIEGNKQAALESFSELAEGIGDAIANAVTLIDGLVVIGGGLSAASELFLQKVVDEMNSQFIKSDGTKIKRLISEAYNLKDPVGLEKFLMSSSRKIKIYGTEKEIEYDWEAKIGVGISKIGTSNAVAMGAYAFALDNLK
jgi:glucokinase